MQGHGIGDCKKAAAQNAKKEKAMRRITEMIAGFRAETVAGHMEYATRAALCDFSDRRLAEAIRNKFPYSVLEKMDEDTVANEANKVLHDYIERDRAAKNEVMTVIFHMVAAAVKEYEVLQAEALASGFLLNMPTAGQVVEAMIHTDSMAGLVEKAKDSKFIANFIWEMPEVVTEV
jgi:hypothetical protein